MNEVESFSQPTSSSFSQVSRKRTRDYSESMWPKRMKVECCNTLFASTEGSWNTLESVTIGETQYNYRQYQECDYDLKLCNSTFTIKSNDFMVNVPCRPVEEKLFLKAKFLYEQVLAFPRINTDTDHVIACYARAAREAKSDSDDEQIPDPAILPAFSDTELPVVKVLFKKFFNTYTRAMIIGLYNCVGKQFLEAAWEYADLCSRHDVTTSSQFLYLYSTSTGPLQPGAMYVKWSLPKMVLKSTGPAAGELRIIKLNERYADHVAYDRVNIINVNVSEVEESEDSAIESQNNEQMLGLWRGSQQVMLGLEVYSNRVRPKILLLDGGSLNMCYLKELDLTKANDLMNLVKLMMAFLICVISINESYL